MMSTHLLIVAPSNLQRAAWRALLEEQPGITVSGTTNDASSLGDPLLASRVTAVLLDMPAIDAAIVTQLHEIMPESGLLILVDAYSTTECVQLLRAGATGFIARNDTVADLARAIIAVGRGEIVLPPSLASPVLAALARGDEGEKRPSETLTGREREVLNYLAHGASDK